ncbi:hypothetical protein PMIN04_009679 [Paraphaeosphaeria minitans]
MMALVDKQHQYRVVPPNAVAYSFACSGLLGAVCSPLASSATCSGRDRTCFETNPFRSTPVRRHLEKSTKSEISRMVTVGKETGPRCEEAALKCRINETS